MSIVQGEIQSYEVTPFKEMFRHQLTINGTKYSVYKKSNAAFASTGSSVTLQITNPTAGTAKVLEVGAGAPVTPQSFQQTYQVEQTPAPSYGAASTTQFTTSKGNADKDGLIIRQTCVKAACEFYASQPVDTSDEIIELARKLEHYVLHG